MISHFLSMCRACPSINIDKLHSEYRSTYRWHEYTPKQNQAVVSKPPQPSSKSGLDGAEFARKKKHPDIAYRSQLSNDMTTRGAMEQGGVQQEEPKMNISYPPPAPSSGWNRRQNSLRAKELVETGRQEPKKSISMGQIQPTGNTPANDKVIKQNQDVNGNSDGVDGVNHQSDNNPVTSSRIREHKSEYKNRFRPFSQYEYIGDGKFQNTSTSPPNEIDQQAGHKFPNRPRQQDNNLTGEPWYQEVIELRKAANDYKQRGWGTDLVPPHMSLIYNQQMSIHEQAARRESLSALALAIPTPRSLNKNEKEKENLRKSTSPNKPRYSRPRTAPPKGFKKPTGSRSESVQPSPTPGVAKDSSKETSAPKEIKPTAGRSVSAGSPAPRSARDSTDNEGWKVHLDRDTPSRASSARRQRPNNEAKDRVGATEGKKGTGVSRNSSKATSRDPSRPPSAIENNIDYFREPVVKSPPEPTRVKSPEQLMMRSPDPINWTVPLDTGKTFSVTQSVRDSDSARNSPMSDHSSHFDSVSGTAVNLGGLHSVNEKGSVQHPKVSALAREAKEMQGIPGSKKDDKSGTEPEGNSNSESTIPQDSAHAVSSINGSHEAPIANGESEEKNKPTTDEKANSENFTPAPETPPVSVPAPSIVSKVSGSNLKCLEDPDFSFDTPAAPSKTLAASGDKTANPSTTDVVTPQTASEPSKPPTGPKKPSYRVLEDPEDLISLPKASPYKVLEDPMTTSFYQQEPLGGTASKQK